MGGIGITNEDILDSCEVTKFEIKTIKMINFCSGTYRCGILHQISYADLKKCS